MARQVRMSQESTTIGKALMQLNLQPQKEGNRGRKESTFSGTFDRKESVSSSPGRKESTPGRKESTPGRKESTPGLKGSTPGLKEPGSGEAESSPSIIESSPERKESTSSRKESSPGTIESTPGRKESSSSRKSLSYDSDTLSRARQLRLSQDNSTMGRAAMQLFQEAQKEVNRGRKVSAPGTSNRKESVSGSTAKKSSYGRKESSSGFKESSPGRKTSTSSDGVNSSVTLHAGPVKDATSGRGDVLNEEYDEEPRL